MLHIHPTSCVRRTLTLSTAPPLASGGCSTSVARYPGEVPPTRVVGAVVAKPSRRSGTAPANCFSAWGHTIGLAATCGG
eukprot:8018961-Pyramimonas_sp.AAC.2